MIIKHSEVKVKLVGTDSNAFSIIGKVGSAMRKAGVLDNEIKEFINEAMSGDYDNLLRVCSSWVTIL